MAGRDVHVGAVPGGLLRPEEGKQANSQIKKKLFKLWGETSYATKIIPRRFHVGVYPSIFGRFMFFQRGNLFSFYNPKAMYVCTIKCAPTFPANFKKVPPIQRHPPRHSLILLELPPWASGVAIGGDAREQISPHLDHGVKVLVSRKKKLTV